MKKKRRQRNTINFSLAVGIALVSVSTDVLRNFTVIAILGMATDMAGNSI